MKVRFEESGVGQEGGLTDSSPLRCRQRGAQKEFGLLAWKEMHLAVTKEAVILIMGFTSSLALTEQ